jgi:hypothetical protein
MMVKALVAGVSAALVVGTAGSAAGEQFDRWEHYQDKFAGIVLKKTGNTYRAVGWTRRAGSDTEWCFRGEGSGDGRVKVSGRMWWPGAQGSRKRFLKVTGSENGRTATVEVGGGNIPGWTIGPAKLKKGKSRYGFGRTCKR